MLFFSECFNGFSLEWYSTLNIYLMHKQRVRTNYVMPVYMGNDIARHVHCDIIMGIIMTLLGMSIVTS